MTVSAPSGAIDRPRFGLFDVSSLLTGFVTTTYAVRPERLEARLPAGLTPEIFRLESGREVAFVSAVSFVNTEFFVGFAPFLRFRCPQTNYRAYVRRRGERAAWFVGTSLDHVSVLLPRHVFRMPWSRSHVTTSARFDGERCVELSWEGRSQAGEERVKLRGTGQPIGCLDGFPDEAETRLVLTHPLVGYFRRRLSGVVARYSVWHLPLELERAECLEARHELFEREGLIEPGQAPHSVLVQRATQYEIFLPPRRVDLAVTPPEYGRARADLPRDAG